MLAINIPVWPRLFPLGIELWFKPIEHVHPLTYKCWFHLNKIKPMVSNLWSKPWFHRNLLLSFTYDLGTSLKITAHPISKSCLFEVWTNIAEEKVCMLSSKQRFCYMDWHDLNPWPWNFIQGHGTPSDQRHSMGEVRDRMYLVKRIKNF